MEGVIEMPMFVATSSFQEESVSEFGLRDIACPDSTLRLSYVAEDLS